MYLESQCRCMDGLVSIKYYCLKFGNLETTLKTKWVVLNIVVCQIFFQIAMFFKNKLILYHLFGCSK